MEDRQLKVRGHQLHMVYQVDIGQRPKLRECGL